MLKTALAAVLTLAYTSAFAQPVVPPQAIEQFQHVIGNRVEAVTILGGDYGAAGGIYSFRGGDVAIYVRHADPDHRQGHPHLERKQTDESYISITD